MFRKTLFQLHWFLGISAGLILSIMGVTGALFSYEQQILKMINQDSYMVAVEDRPKLSPEQIYSRVQQQHPDFQINSVTVAAQPNESASINIAKEGARRGLTLMVNPYNAELLSEIKGREFFSFVEKLHRNLTLGPVGKQLTGACALILIFFVLSGLYMRWPKKHSLRQWLSLKTQLKGRNFIWNLHAVVGTWVMLFYLLLACTGLYWSYDWWRNGMFSVLGVEQKQESSAKKGPDSGDKQAKGAQQNHADGPRPGKDKTVESTSRLTTAEAQTALNLSWTVFQQQFQQRYSSATFNLPKAEKPHEVEISFFDPQPQHERARNKAMVDLQQQRLKKVELYADKKLNEKIMSSMLPVHRGSFFGPVYQFLVMLAALSMPLFFITGWMLYLKRRAQKKLTQAARQSSVATAFDPDATPWLVVYASQTGTAEQLAWHTATILQNAYQPVTVKSVHVLSLHDLASYNQILVVASTYGTGQAPDMAVNFVKKILTAQPDLSHIRYAILALGSREYPETYCSFGHQISFWFQQQHAQALFPVFEVNNAQQEDIQRWSDALAQATQLELKSLQVEQHFDQWTLSKRELLNPGSLGAPAYLVELQTDHDVSWQAGDIAVIQPGNCPERIQDFLKRYGYNSNENLCHSLLYKDLNTVVPPKLSTEQLMAQLPELPIREYSIASIPTQGLLRLVVRQKLDQQHQLGLGSGWLTQYVPLQGSIRLRIRTNPGFHLISDNRPIICIGNGTGLAGLISLISARVRLDYTDNWLIFGERQRQHDFFFEALLTAWQTTGMLKRLDLAFSRDQAEKIYVHHILRQQAEELRTWIGRGAVIYVCGSIHGMATDVDQALHDILGEHTMDQLRQEQRYRRDVY